MITKHIAPGGNDSGPGTEAQPLATLEGARNALRALPAEERADGATVLLHAGVYPRSTSFLLTAEDSGTPDAPITYQAAPGEVVRLTGGRTVREFAPVTDAAVLRRFAPEARGQVVQCDLRAAGITDFGRLTARGFGRPSTPAHTELFFRGRPMTLARWPNEGNLAISGVPMESIPNPADRPKFGRLHEGFYLRDERMRRWARLSNLWVHGYWAYDWANSYEAVDRMDLDTGLITTKPPHGTYGFRTGNRFHFLNVLEELDAPGEYYVDVESGILYFWPPEPLDDSAMVSLLAEPFVLMRDVSHVTLMGLEMTCSRGSGVVMTGGTGNVISGCAFSLLGQHGVTVAGGSGHTVTGCEISHVGDGGILLSGGDRSRLTPGSHIAHNNHIHHFARWSRCYQPAIGLSGVGLRVANNLIHDGPHIAILYAGNEHLIELNEIHHVVLETNDAGAVYSGRDPSMQGNVIRYNYFHHIGGMPGHGSASVYLDDGHCGHTVFGNIFYKGGLPGRANFGAAFTNGGRGNTIENNIFIECPLAFNEHAWPEQKWVNYWSKPPHCERLFGAAVDVRKPPYSEKYPRLANILTDARPNVLARNIVYRCGAFRDRGTQELTDNLVETDPLFVDLEHNDFRLRADSPAWALGFQRIPVEEIGLVRAATGSSTDLPTKRLGASITIEPASTEESKP